MASARSQFERLLKASLDGPLAEHSREQLEELLNEHPEFIEEYASQVSLHSLLQWQSVDVAREAAAAGLDCAPEGKLLARGRSASPYSTGLWAAAAVLVVGSGFLFWQILRSAPLDASAVAEIVAENNVAWAENSTALAPNRLIVPGRLSSDAGSYTLKFRSGATVHVVGAASLNVESAMLVGLDRGQATARVTDSSKGFTLKTPLVNVVDQGTQFGVSVGDDGETDVIVFEGKVDVRKNDAGGEQTRLVQGEAVRIDPKFGVIGRLMQVQRDVHGAWWSTGRPNHAEHVISEVRDNIPPSDGSKYFCYQITFDGLEDDVFAYADHPHQWNGLTAEGLPPFLRGADFVKTFNDYRYMNDFEMTIELSGPADLYVFFDDRVPTPVWLKGQFADTGVDIGLDEGYWPEVPDHATATGGGASIDNVFSVWRRRCLDGKPVTLGLVGNSSEARAMYGVAASPRRR